MQLILLDYADLALAWGLIAMAIGLSAWQRLGLEWQIGIAAIRTFIQLLIVGYLLYIVFDPQARNPWLVLGVFLVMLTIAATVAQKRISQKIKGLLPLVWGAIFVSTTVSISYTSLLIIQPKPWYEPQYVIPLAGMIMGNAMNSAAITGERLVSMINSMQIEIETCLSLGATTQQAVIKYRQESIKAGMISILNQMTIIGIVTLPGTVTGQLLSGVNPLDAVAYQMLIMFTIALADLISSMLITEALCRQFFNDAAQLKKFT